jgi:hypothetical protein
MNGTKLFNLVYMAQRRRTYRRWQLESVNRTARREEAEQPQEWSATRSWNVHVRDGHMPESDMDMEKREPHRLRRAGFSNAVTT